MKKIISILIVALVALAFMGCPTTYSDLPYGIKDPNCIWNWTSDVNSGKSFTLDAFETTADGYTTSFNLPNLPEYKCCLLAADNTDDLSNWPGGTQYGGSVSADGSWATLSVGGDLKITTGSAGKVVVKVEGTTVSAKFVAD